MIKELLLSGLMLGGASTPLVMPKQPLQAEKMTIKAPINDNVLEGTWYFNETITPFVDSNGGQMDISLTINVIDTWDNNLYQYNTSLETTNFTLYDYDTNSWTNSFYRTITFYSLKDYLIDNNSDLNVGLDVFNWVKSNAIKVSELDVVNNAYNDAYNKGYEDGYNAANNELNIGRYNIDYNTSVVGSSNGAIISLKFSNINDEKVFNISGSIFESKMSSALNFDLETSLPVSNNNPITKMQLYTTPSNELKLLVASYSGTTTIWAENILLCTSSSNFVTAINCDIQPYRIGASFEEGRNEGYKSGYQVGLREGKEKGRKEALEETNIYTPFGWLRDLSVLFGGILAIELAPNFTIGGLILIPLVFSMVALLLGLFRKGGK